jgi:hypothetical protein
VSERAGPRHVAKRRFADRCRRNSLEQLGKNYPRREEQVDLRVRNNLEHRVRRRRDGLRRGGEARERKEPHSEATRQIYLGNVSQMKYSQIMQLQSDLISLAEQERHFVYVEKNYGEADRVKHEIEEKEEQLKKLRTVRDKPEQAEKKTDAPTMFKVLSVAEALLRSPTLTRFNPAIATLHSEVINPALIHEDDRVKAKALKCYALCCVIDRRSARYGIHLFSGLVSIGWRVSTFAE